MNDTVRKDRPVIMYLLAIIQVLLLGWGSYMTGRVDRVEGKQLDHLADAQQTVREFEGRVSALEAKFDAIQVQLDRIEAAVAKEHTK